MSSNESPKKILFDQFASVAQALGNGHRLDILEHLAQGERGVEALSSRVGLSVANTSQHLQHLKRAGLVVSRRDGKFILYQLSDETVLSLLAALRLVAERNLAEVNQIIHGYFADRDNMEPVSRAELLQRSRDGVVTILDVRPADEFATGHVPGAINVEPSELEARLAHLNPDLEIIAYCRGPYCVLSFEAVATLRDYGFNVRRMEEGYPEWKAAGYPVETVL